MAVSKIAPVAGKRLEVFDTLTPGLALRITEGGKKSWSVMYRVAGRSADGNRGPLRRMTLGAYPLIDLRAARDRARAAIDLADRGDDPADKRRDEARQKGERVTDHDNDLPARLISPGPGGEGRTHWKVMPKGLAIIEELAGRGCHLTTIAQVLGMHVATLREVRKRDPEVDEAYQRGLAREHDVLVGNLRQAADEGNIVASIYLLKAKHALYDQPSPHSATNVQVNVDNAGVLVVPPKLSVEQFLEERRAAGGRIPGQHDPDTIEGVVERIPQTRRGD